MPENLLKKVYELSLKGVPFAVATVVRTEGMTSAKVGSKAIIVSDGTVIGWVGGSCALSAVAEQALGALKDERPRLLSLGPLGQGSKGVVEVVTDCASGGIMEIYIEPYPPNPELLVIGQTPVAETLSRLGELLRFNVVVASPGATRESFPNADRLLSELDLTQITPQTYVVIAAHQTYPQKTDEELLKRVINTEAQYIGLIASKKRAAAVLQSLLGSGLPAEAIGKLRAPAGLSLGSSLKPEEIALSIMAEIVSLRKGGTGEPIPTAVVTEASKPFREGDRAKDPICGMIVDEEVARYTSSGEGRIYYFCSAHCKSQFDASPVT